MNNSSHAIYDDEDVAVATSNSHSFDYIFEGVLTTFVSVVGMGCNILAVVVLSRPRMRGSFHTLLVRHAWLIFTASGLH